MSYSIREGEKKDMQAVLELINELALFEKLPNEVEISIQDLLRDGFSDKPKFKTFVAEEDAVIIGVALFYERYSTWKGRIFHLEDLIVRKDKRGLGAGFSLYQAVLKFAHDTGAKRVSWDVLDWNKDAINFYKNTGATILEDWQVVHMTRENLENFIENTKG